MEFRLTYAGRLLAHRKDRTFAKRSLRVHDIRKEFHKQLKFLWGTHPTLQQISNEAAGGIMHRVFQHDGFKWLPIVTTHNGLFCKLEILMLRSGQPGGALQDIDNRLKTIFDALRQADGPDELGARTETGQVRPGADEDPFFVLLQNDNLITHLAVTTDRLLEPVPDVPEDEAVRLVIDVTVRPYHVHMDNLGFA